MAKANIESLRGQPFLYELLKLILGDIDRLKTAAPGTGTTTTTTTIVGIPTDGEDNEILAFSSDSPDKLAWKSPHEIDTFVSRVF